MEQSQNVPYNNLISTAEINDFASPTQTEVVKQHQVLSMDNDGTILNISCSKQSNEGREPESIFSAKRHMENAPYGDNSFQQDPSYQNIKLTSVTCSPTKTVSGKK